LDDVDGTSVVHAAGVALAKDVAAIRRRLWRAELGIIFPFIEEQRVRLVERLRRYLCLPFETPFGRIDDPNDLEIGHLLWMARRNRAPHQTLRLLERLVRMRHALAHIEPVPYEDIVESAV
jgi:hypothetical protein